jgi:hypothetical protein
MITVHVALGLGICFCLSLLLQQRLHGQHVARLGAINYTGNKTLNVESWMQTAQGYYYYYY